MSAPNSNHSDKNYPEDKVSHYPKAKALKGKTGSGSYKIVSCPKCGNTKDNHMPGCPAVKN